VALRFEEKEIGVKKAIEGVKQDWRTVRLTPDTEKLWANILPGHGLNEVHSKGWFFNHRKLDPNQPCATIAATCNLMHWSEPRRMTAIELLRLQSFPDDFNFGGQPPTRTLGMSVPPFMVQRLAHQLDRQLLEGR
jgi:DNA (cytosine-5)-methyltransferase 1